MGKRENQVNCWFLSFIDLVSVKEYCRAFAVFFSFSFSKISLLILKLSSVKLLVSVSVSVSF